MFNLYNHLMTLQNQIFLAIFWAGTCFTEPPYSLEKVVVWDYTPSMNCFWKHVVGIFLNLHPGPILQLGTHCLEEKCLPTKWDQYIPVPDKSIFGFYLRCKIDVPAPRVGQLNPTITYPPQETKGWMMPYWGKPMVNEPLISPRYWRGTLWGGRLTNHCWTFKNCSINFSKKNTQNLLHITTPS